MHLTNEKSFSFDVRKLEFNGLQLLIGSTREMRMVNNITKDFASQSSMAE